MKPLVIDLFCGLGGWSKGFLAEGYEAIGFDIGRHAYGDKQYPGQLVLQDVRTLHGSQFRNAACIVASPPCQEFSRYAMPFGALWLEHARMDDDGAPPGNYLGKPTPYTGLFHMCFRLQREACEAAGRYIPLVVENVKGAQRFVGPAAWRYGSYYLWGDVPAIMPFTRRAQKFNPDGTQHGQGSWFAVADSKERGTRKNSGGSWFNEAHNTSSGHGRNPVNGQTPRARDEIKTVGHVNQRDGYGHTRHLTNQHESDAVKNARFRRRMVRPGPGSVSKQLTGP